MSVNYSGAALVRVSFYFTLDNQVAIIDRLMSGNNIIPGALWNSSAFLGVLRSSGLYPLLKACISDNAIYAGTKTYAKEAGSPPLIDIDTTLAGACTGGAGQLPNQVAGLIRWQSAVGGNRGKGRDYMPFPYTAACDPTGLLNAAYAADLQTFATALGAGFGCPNVGIGGGTITVRPVTRYTVGTTPPLAFSMLSSSVAEGFATQRRRGYFGKPNSNPF